MSEAINISKMSDITDGCNSADKKYPQDIAAVFSDVMCGVQYTKINPMFFFLFTNIRERSNSVCAMFRVHIYLAGIFKS